ncbi:hypothetical protein MP228_008845 [Amoeboaphelidium protococcarum]|nr:hypothetical protein MP228_008845 [Amoeboaphelidium protococcarum]
MELSATNFDISPNVSLQDLTSSSSAMSGGGLSRRSSIYSTSSDDYGAQYALSPMLSMQNLQMDGDADGINDSLDDSDMAAMNPFQNVPLFAMVVSVILPHAWMLF